MKSLASWLLVFFMAMFWVFRIIVTLSAQFGSDFGGFIVFNNTLEIAMLFISLLGDDGILWLAIGVICLFFKNHRKMGVQLLLSMLCTFILGNLIIQ